MRSRETPVPGEAGSDSHCPDSESVRNRATPPRLEPDEPVPPAAKASPLLPK
jgi:hypothetical protein